MDAWSRLARSPGTLADRIVGPCRTLTVRQSRISGPIAILEDRESLRMMLFGGGIQGAQWMDAPGDLAIPFCAAALAALEVVPSPRRILCLGLGAGSLPRALARLVPAATVDAVELDPEVAELAAGYFGFRSSERVRLFLEDGRSFLERTPPGVFDLVVLDAFGGGPLPAAPEQLTDRGAVVAIARALSPAGAVVGNGLAADIDPRHGAILSRWREAFGHVATVAIPGTRNELWMGQR